MLSTFSRSVPSKYIKHGSSWSIFLSAASYCIWQVEISYPTSLPRNLIDQYPSEVSLCLLHPQCHDSKHCHQQKVLFQTQYLIGCHLCTERTTRDQERCPGGHPTKPEPSQILLHLQQLVVVWSKEKKRIYPFQCLATDSIAKHFAFKEFMSGCIKCLFKIQYECVNLSSIVQDFSPIIYYRIVNWVSQLCPFLKYTLLVPLWQEFIFIKMSLDIWTYYVFE